jgi:hypothetical protein
VSAFQLIALPLIAWLAARSLFRLVRGQGQRRWLLVTTVIWLAAGAAILRPEVTNAAAHLLGIGRGADLVVYAMTIAFLLSLFFVLNKIRQLETHITTVVRELAIRDAGELGAATDASDQTPTQAAEVGRNQEE